MNGLFLRPVEERDLVAFFEQQNEPEALLMTASEPRDREAFSARWRTLAGDPAVVRRTIVFESRAAGYVARFERAGEPEVCYWLGREFWGRGIATAALAAFLEEFPERPLYARVIKANPASRRVLEKCGFALIGEDVFTNARGEPTPEFVFRLD